MSQLLEFLTNLAVEPSQQQAFQLTPSTVMAASGLSRLEQAAIESKTKSRITEILASECFQAALTVGVPEEDPIPYPDEEPPPIPPDEPPSALPKEQGLKR